MPILSEDGLAILIEEKLQGWNRGSFTRLGAKSLYVFLCVMSFYAVVDASQSGHINAIQQLFALFGNIGANLLANIIQNWVNAPKAAEELEALLANPERRRRVLPNLDAALLHNQVIETAGRLLPQEDRQWYLSTLKEELSQMGNIERYAKYFENVNVHGNVTVFTGDGVINIEGRNKFYGEFHGPKVKKGRNDD